MRKQLLAGGLLLVGLLAGCGKSGGPAGEEASIPELNRALQVWVMSKASLPANVSDLTNFPALQGKRMPTPPPGKKLAIDPRSRQVIFVDQ
jgi:hypothetical protein